MTTRQQNDPGDVGSGTGRTRTVSQKAVVTTAGQIRPGDDYRPELGDILLEGSD